MSVACIHGTSLPKESLTTCGTSVGEVYSRICGEDSAPCSLVAKAAKHLADASPACFQATVSTTWLPMHAFTFKVDVTRRPLEPTV